ncbi:MAG TPA: glycosyl transferase family 36 [Candidatus Marinimicrobia bacterium]|nr:glycosyl transferase family 36 [Candidatus Neomarinimicrobiota bacterium]
MYANKYGYFDNAKREFVISNPRTPRPWFNYMWNERYGGLISHTSGGFSFMESPRDNRINRMRYNCLPWDRPGRYVMVRDSQTGKYWSLSWAPTIEIPYKKYEARHGMSYTSIETEFEAISGKISYFVPREIPGEVWRVSLKNLGDTERSLELYAFTELLMGNALNDLINQPNDKHFSDIHFDKELDSLVASRRYWVLNKGVSVKQPNLAWPYNLYFSSTRHISGFDGSLDQFIGKWRSEANPIAIEEGKMRNTEITAGDPIGALQTKLLLQPGESAELAFYLIAREKKLGHYPVTEWQPMKETAFWDAELEKVKSHWKNYLDSNQIQSPDEVFNTHWNIWNQYQAAVTFDMARNSGYYHGGLLFGTGMRDQFQDILGALLVEPQRVRARLLNALKYQFKNGSSLHNFFKLTGTGERTHHSDTPLWIPFGLVEYLKETGDFTILQEDVTFYDGESASVYSHLVRALDYALESATERGLPKIMNGDWNDTLDHVGPEGKGESIWGAFFLGYVIQRACELFAHVEDQENLQRFELAFQNLNETVNEIAWDGEWYVRAFRDDGRVIGSSKDEQGKIFLNAQSWALISGMTSPERAKKTLRSAEKFLLRDQGMQICWPSYTKVDDSVGLISRCVPGKKENGAIFNHASSWFVMAAIAGGDKALAWKVYSRMLPQNSARNIDRYETEPYVFSEYVTTIDHDTAGQASHSWLTGTAVWMLYIGINSICGIQADFDGLRLQPNFPNEWKELKVERTFRGNRRILRFLNPNGMYSRIKSIEMEGEIIQGTHIPENLWLNGESPIVVFLE